MFPDLPRRELHHHRGIAVADYGARCEGPVQRGQFVRGEANVEHLKILGHAGRTAHAHHWDDKNLRLTTIRLFGSWTARLEAAGLYRLPSGGVYSLIVFLRYRAENRQSITIAALRKEGKFGCKMYREAVTKFGGWKRLWLRLELPLQVMGIVAENSVKRYNALLNLGIMVRCDIF